MQGCSREMLGSRVVEMCGRKEEKTVVEKCWRRGLYRSDVAALERVLATLV